MCDLEIRVLGNVQPYTVMCALPVNLFNEIVFIFVWFWLAIMGICTSFSILYWLVVSVIIPTQTKFIKTRLIAMGKLGSAPHHMVKSFVTNYLRNDGILIIQLVAENATDFIAAELICALWDLYRNKADTSKRTERKTRGPTPIKSGYERDVDTDDDEKNTKIPRTYFGRYYSRDSKDEPTESETEDERRRYDDDDEYYSDEEGDRPPIRAISRRRGDMQLSLRVPGKDAAQLRKEKILKDKRERELKEFKRGDRKNLRSGYKQ